MAKVTNLVILNPADKTRMYSVAIGNGTPADADDPIVSDVRSYPVGSQFIDLTAKKFYIRTAKTKASTDWVEAASAAVVEAAASAAAAAASATEAAASATAAATSATEAAASAAAAAASAGG